MNGSTTANSAALRLRRRRLRRLTAVAAQHLVLCAAGVLFAIPFLWLVITSLKPLEQVFTDPPTWIPHPVLWGNYVEALTSPAFPFLRLLRNTLFYTVVSTVGVVFSGALVAYGFARMEFWGRDVLFGITLSTMMLPGVVTLIPTYILFRLFGWVGSYAPLIVPAYFGGAFNIFLLRQFFMTVPWELTDAAKVDGASELRIFWQVMLPLIKPALLVVAVFHFMWAWNDFMGPLIYLDDAREYPLVMGLYAFQTRHGIKWNLMMAASLAVAFPIIVLFFIAQRYFIEGIALTGLKG
ncbi:MAG: carbohydrate ABC transporter permease [Anaerolineae bacterium]|nr:carbohydrate ABC transporter permease [Anaerolineae bacterium]